MFPFSSTLTEALILHMAERADIDIAKHIDREVLSGRLMQDDERRWKAAVEKSPSKKAICICRERAHRSILHDTWHFTI